MSYPYVMSGEKLKKFLEKLPTLGTPQKVTFKFFQSLGFTSSNDKRMLPLLKFIGLVDAHGVPTPLWAEMRSKPKVAIAKGVRQGYADLFSHYPDAHLKDDEALRIFFSAQTTLGAGAIGKVVTTFKSLCQIADFEAAGSPAAPGGPAHAAPKPVVPPTATPAAQPSGGMTVNVNIQLQVPPDATGEIYEKFFAAMKKHLWSSQK